MNLKLDAPNLGEIEQEALKACLDSGFVSTVGPFVREFEEVFAQFVGTNCAVSSQSGTAAIHLALYELGIGPGDEVIVPVTTFVATVNPILYVNATPVFVDVDSRTWNIDPEEVRDAITSRTKAIIPVHLYGNPCDMEVLMQISREFGIPVIEDATESLGATFDSRQTGSFGHFGCFSFNGNKVITTGGGGMIVTNSEKAADHVKFLANQARDERRGYYHPEIGFNYRMTNLEASLGLAQFSRLSTFIQKKRLFRSIYEDAFKASKAISLQEEHACSKSSWWLSCISVDLDNLDLDELRKNIASLGIPTRRLFCPVTDFPPYRPFKTRDFPVANMLYQRCLCLPSSTLNKPAEVEKAAQKILQLLES